MTMPGRGFQVGKYRFGFGGKEKDNEVKGDGNELDFGDRTYDPRDGRWLSVDPLQKKYPGFSPYNAFGNNPIILKDPDGRDIVYFNNKAHEILRIKSSTSFETYVQVNKTNNSLHSNFNLSEIVKSLNTPVPFVGDFQKAPMPNIISEKLRTDKDGEGNWKVDKGLDVPKFQKYDYQIAATTFLFNQNKNNTQFYTEGGNAIPIKENIQIPNLDPTLLKAMAFQESTMGQIRSDIMSINNKGDYPKGGGYKAAYGVKKEDVINASTSINMAPNYLVTKGFRGGINNGTFTWMGGNNNMQAATTYNGGGVDNYHESTQRMLNTSHKPVAADYNVPKKY